MILYFAGDGTSPKIRPEDVIEEQGNVGVLFAYYKIHTAKSSESTRRFKIIKKKRTVNP
jgi:hypothetical protein